MRNLSFEPGQIASKKIRGFLSNVARRVQPDLDKVRKIATFPLSDFQADFELPTAQISNIPDSEIARRNRLAKAITAEAIYMINEVTRIATEQVIANRPVAEPELTQTTIIPQIPEAPAAAEAPTPIEEDISFIRGISVIRDMDRLFKKSRQPQIGEYESRDNSLARFFHDEIYPLAVNGSVVTTSGLREGYVALAELYRRDSPKFDKEIAEKFPGIL